VQARRPVDAVVQAVELVRDFVHDDVAARPRQLDVCSTSAQDSTSGPRHHDSPSGKPSIPRRHVACRILRSAWKRLG
jgi:hypothetical protein